VLSDGREDWKDLRDQRAGGVQSRVKMRESLRNKGEKLWELYLRIQGGGYS
jgi:hypothetical protein